MLRFRSSSSSWLYRRFGPDTCTASPSSTSRWAMVLPAFATHMCLGSPYGWSAVSGTLAREIGFAVPAADDWAFSEVTLPLSLVFALQGIAAAAGGKWQMKVGHRIAMLVAGGCFGGGLSLAALGIHLHNLPLLYAGYGLLAGTGVGLGYTPPLAALMEWFPDKKGLASGLCIAGFGSGALFFAPVVTKLMDSFKRMPEYVGSFTDNLKITSQEGRLFALDSVTGKMKEVVKVNASDLAKLPYDLAEGYYAVGTGATGAAEALAICGGSYLGIMLLSSMFLKRPAPGYTPSASGAPASSQASTTSNTQPVAQPQTYVSIENAMKSPQFYLLATTFFCMACGGMGLFSVAKPMMSEVFSGSLPALVTAAFAGNYVMMLSAANLSGRIGWASVSDIIGRRKTFFIITSLSVPLYLSIPYLVDSVVTTQGSVPLYMFIGSTFAAITCMGATYAILPAYEADLFGAKYVGAIHGRMLLASTAGSLIGPSLLLKLRGNSERGAIKELMDSVDPAKFEQAFGAPVNSIDSLIKAKTVTITKLMELAPPGVVDPTPYIYDSTMYTMSGLMVLATISHSLVRPVKKELFEK